MIFVILGIVLVIAVCAIAASSSSKATAQRDQQLLDQKKLADTISARQPTAYQKLFGEEFPDHLDDITYTKADKILQSWSKILSSRQYKRHLKTFGSGFRDDQAKRDACTVVVSQIAPIISEDFCNLALKDPIVFAQKLESVLNSSHRMAGDE